MAARAVIFLSKMAASSAAHGLRLFLEEGNKLCVVDVSIDRVNPPGDARPRWLFHMTRILEGGKMGATDVLQLIGLSRRCEEEYFVYTSPPFASAAERQREGRVLNLFTDAMSPGLEQLFARVPLQDVPRRRVEWRLQQRGTCGPALPSLDAAVRHEETVLQLRPGGVITAKLDASGSFVWLKRHGRPTTAPRAERHEWNRPLALSDGLEGPVVSLQVSRKFQQVSFEVILYPEITADELTGLGRDVCGEAAAAAVVLRRTSAFTGSEPPPFPAPQTQTAPSAEPLAPPPTPAAVGNKRAFDGSGAEPSADKGRMSMEI